MTLRIPPASIQALNVIAQVERVSFNEAVRRALAAHIEQQRRDDSFKARLRTMLAAEHAERERAAGVFLPEPEGEEG